MYACDERKKRQWQVKNLISCEISQLLELTSYDQGLKINDWVAKKSNMKNSSCLMTPEWHSWLNLFSCERKLRIFALYGRGIKSKTWVILNSRDTALYNDQAHYDSGEKQKVLLKRVRSSQLSISTGSTSTRQNILTTWHSVHIKNSSLNCIMSTRVCTKRMILGETFP